VLSATSIALATLDDRPVVARATTRYVPGVSAAGDEPRLLHARSELGYTHVPALALRDEPEAVDEATQQAFTFAARRAREQRTREAWSQTHATISNALASFEQTRPDARALEAARDVERAARRADRRLGLS
jgi:hypothetical protein